MTIEQLQAARAEKWRQKANPLLTIEDAEAWIESAGVALFLPRKAQLQTPAPSFVEAVLGETSAMPAPAAIQQAFDLAARLFATEKATPLNLLGAVSEQPDFLVSPEAMPYVFALRGDRDWKRGPGKKSSPLVVEAWKLLKQEGALTTSEVQEMLGREVTEAAVLRALSELWTALRILPVYAAGESTTWELFESRHQKAMQMGSSIAQATALSALISLYLDTAIAATSDEIEVFLSPLAPRSRIREVVHGLTATRQLLTIPLGTQSLLHIAGGLPAFPEIEAPAEIAAEAESGIGAVPTRAPRPFSQRKPFVPRERDDRPRRERPPFGDRPAARDARRHSSGFRRSGSEGPRKEWKPRREEGERREFRPREEKRPFEKKKWQARREDSEGRRGEFRPRRAEGGGGFGKPYRRTASGGSGEQRPYKKFPPRDRDQQRPERKEWKPRREGSQEGRGEFRPRRAEGGGGFGKPYRRNASEGSGEQQPYKKFPPRDRDQQRPERKEWKPRREEGERRGFRPRRAEGSSERREFKSRPASGRGFKPRREGSGFGGGEKSAGRKQFGTKRSFEDRQGFDRNKPVQRERRVEGGEAERPRKSFSKPGFKGGKKFGPPKKSGGRKPSFGSRGGKPAFGKRPNNRKGKKSGE